jgi:RNA polymerase subunit RPABC4/transcription elongation factor Spt4
MALIKCPECHQSISDDVRVCPHCGFKQFNVTTLWGAIIGFFIIFLTIGNLMEKYTSLPMPYIISLVGAFILSIYGYNKRATPN